MGTEQYWKMKAKSLLVLLAKDISPSPVRLAGLEESDLKITWQGLLRRHKGLDHFSASLYDDLPSYEEQMYYQNDVICESPEQDWTGQSETEDDMFEYIKISGLMADFFL
jgi:hypothetical protein